MVRIHILCQGNIRWAKTCMTGDCPAFRAFPKRGPKVKVAENPVMTRV